MNNLVVGGSGVTRLDDPVLGPSYVVAHEIAHGWTMNASGYQEFIAAMSRAAGRDLMPTILPWLEGKYIPDVDAQVAGDQVIVSQRQPDVVFDLPLVIALTKASGDTVRRTVPLTRRAETVSVGDLGPVTAVRVDPDRRFLLRRHLGEVVRFELSAASVPEAKTVELAGNFASRPVPATRSGDSWIVELPISEGRYIWQWRVDGQAPNDEATFAAVNASPTPGARAGIRVVKPLVRVADGYPR